MKRRAYLNRVRRAAARQAGLEDEEQEQVLLEALKKSKKDDKALKNYINYKKKEDPDIIEKLGKYIPSADLSDMNLNQRDFTKIKGLVTVSHTNFSDCELERSNFSGLRIGMANFENADLTMAQFVGANLNFTNINNTVLRGANFTRATMANANMATADGLERVIFNHADLTNVVIMNGEVKECSFIGVKKIHSVNGTSFKKTDLVGIEFEDEGALEGCTFSMRTDLSRITYSGSFGNLANLESLIFEGANLEGSSAENGSFVGTNFNRANMKSCKLKGGDFTNAKMRNTILIEADLSDGSNFEGADLTDAKLRGANLDGADLTGVLSIDGADLTGADLRGADLSGVDLSNVTLKNIKTDKRTKLDMSFGRKLRKFVTRRAYHNPTAGRRVASRFVEGLYGEEVESNEEEHMGMYDHMSEDQELMAMMDDHMGYEEDLMGYDMDDEF